MLCYLAESVGKPERAGELLGKKQSIRESRPYGPPDDLKPASGEIYNACKSILGLTQIGNDSKTFTRDTFAGLIKPGMPIYEELRADIFGD